VSGAISTNTTWNSAGSPYIVTSSITVNSGITLTIQSGVTVQFNDGFGMSVLGTLDATSTIFTSSSGSPTAGKWTTLTIGTSVNKGVVTLTSCQLSYGQQITIVRGSLTTNSTDISNFQSYGVYLNGYATDSATASITGGTFTNCGTAGIYNNQNGKYTLNGTNLTNAQYGIYVSGNATGTSSVTGGVIGNMSQAGIYLNNNTATTATNVTINGNCLRGLYLNGGAITLSGCTITACTTPVEYQNPSSLVISGTSNSFSGNTNKYIFINHSTLGSSMVLPSLTLPYYFPNGYTINATGRLQLSDGNILKFASAGINVYQGKLIATASVGSQIYFTSFKDDNLGGDANGDASATAPAINQWSGIDFPGATIDSACIMRRVTIKYADRGVEIASASPTIDSCTFSVNYHGVYIMDDSYPVITGCTFGSSGLTPIAQTFDADPVFTGNIFSFQDNQYDAIGLIGSSIVANAVLKIRSVTTSPNVTYVMLGDITIPVGRSLTINKGIVIKSPAGSYYKINVQGALYANGTVDSNIVMTSVRDDNAGSPGDTNKDGTQTSPAKGDFGGIVFAPGSLNASIVNYCDIRFASLYQTNYASQTQSGGAVTTVNVNPTISNCKITNCNIGIMCYQASNPTITNNQITNSSSTPMAISVSANPTFSGNTFTNAGYLALGIIGENVTASGLIQKRNISGYTNITYVLLSQLTIANGTNIEVEAGVVIKFLDYVGIDVNGGFKINGKNTSRIVFTTVKDDNVGNPFDTNGDGNATTPSSGTWLNINYNASSDDVYSAIRGVDIKFAGYSNGSAVKWNNAAAAMDDCNITNTSGFGLRIEGNSNPVIDSVQLMNGSNDPIGMSLTSDPTFTNITFTANATKGIRIIDVNLSSNALLKKRSMAGISNIAYFIFNLTIDATATLTIEPGVVIKSVIEYSAKAITVNGAINAQGTNAQKIVFTSGRDDSNGGDYNNDGNNSSPAKNNWDGIVFNSSSLPSTLKNCIFRYGGGYYGNEGVITTNSVSITMDSCLIEQSSSPAIGVYGASSTSIQNAQMLNIENVPVMMSMFSTPIFGAVSLSNVKTIGLGIITETYSQNATIPIRNFAGYTNISYIGLGTFTVNAGTTITIPAGIVYKGGNWIVNGRLNVSGTAASPVVFTCVADDAYGNPLDTRQDGNLEDPKVYMSGSNYIQFEDISNDSSTIKNTIFRYVNAADIRLNSASPTIDSCTFQASQYGLYLAGVSQPVLNRSKFDNMAWNNGLNAGYPIFTSVLSYPSSTLNNTISGVKTFKGIGILDETLSQDITLPKRNFAGITNIPYIFGSFTVGSGATLTIASGVVCKFVANGQLYVNKGLIAEGGSTADSTIVFTSIKDDFYAGDTNADSNYTDPNFTDWYGINLDNQAINSLCRFKNVIVKQAYYGISMTSKSPAVSNSLFRNNSEGLRLTGASNPVVSNCDFVGNSNYGINNVDKSFTISAQNCWWGSNTGPTHTSNSGGTGDKVTDAVSFNPFRTIDAQNPVMGDVSLNGQVQAYDAALILQKSVSLITFNTIQTRMGDVSGTAGITAFDASLVLQFVVNQIRTFPAEELFKTLPTFPAFAQLTVENKTVNAGDEINIPITLTNVNSMKSFDLHLGYDVTLFDFVSLTSGAYLDGQSVSQRIDPVTGEVILSVAGISDMGASGEVCYLKLKAKENAVSGQTKISVNLFLANEDDMLANVSGGNIDVKGTQPTGLTTISNLSGEKIYPNPFQTELTVSFAVRNGGEQAKMIVYSVLGEKVFELEMQSTVSGVNRLVWDGLDKNGAQLPNGSYTITIQSGNERLMQRAMLLK
jgi:parallel beta-helix repeat protein